MGVLTVKLNEYHMIYHASSTFGNLRSDKKIDGKKETKTEKLAFKVRKLQFFGAS